MVDLPLAACHRPSCDSSNLLSGSLGSNRRLVDMWRSVSMDWLATIGSCHSCRISLEQLERQDWQAGY